MSFLDLHNHLYGSLKPEKLFEIGINNPNPRWEIFTNLHKKITGEEINIKSFFEDYKDMERFKKLYLFNKRAPFLEFQSKFNLIIALIKFDEEEIKTVGKEIVSVHSEENISFAEYRIMYAPKATRQEYFNKTIAACEGLKLGEQNSPNTKARLVVSLHRDGNYQEQYKWIKDLLTENDLVRHYLVGIDFCYIEEGFPPKEKKSFFETVIQDNHNNPHTALSILYHVGESFADKTPKSAVRWIGESAINGAHRLGHCIALGINPESFANQTISETIGERLDQINFEIFHYEKIKSFGKIKDFSKLKQERDLLANKDFDSKISFAIDKNYIEELNAFQDFVIYLVRDESESVIECCPTSNLYIGMLPNMGEHPIHRFLKNKLRITIGSDDPGIFETSLSQEYSLVANAGIPPKVLENIQKSSVSFISEKLSGRKA